MKTSRMLWISEYPFKESSQKANKRRIEGRKKARLWKRNTEERAEVMYWESKKQNGSKTEETRVEEERDNK